jgi:hypothetical protein
LTLSTPLVKAINDIEKKAIENMSAAEINTQNNFFSLLPFLKCNKYKKQDKGPKISAIGKFSATPNMVIELRLTFPNINKSV